MAQVSGVQPDEMKLFFRGKHFDGETMAEAGVKPGAKVLLVECENFRQRRASEMEADREQASQRAAATEKQQRRAQEEAHGRAAELEAERVERQAKEDEARKGVQAVAEVEREVDPLAREVCGRSDVADFRRKFGLAHVLSCFPESTSLIDCHFF